MSGVLWHHELYFNGKKMLMLCYLHAPISNREKNAVKKEINDINGGVHNRGFVT